MEDKTEGADQDTVLVRISKIAVVKPVVREGTAAHIYPQTQASEGINIGALSKWPTIITVSFQ